MATPGICVSTATPSGEARDGDHGPVPGARQRAPRGALGEGRGDERAARRSSPSAPSTASTLGAPGGDERVGVRVQVVLDLGEDALAPAPRAGERDGELAQVAVERVAAAHADTTLWTAAAKVCHSRRRPSSAPWPSRVRR